jgi:predicted Zn-dependent peptidase
VPAGPTLEGALRRLDATLVESAFELDAARANRSVLELDVRVPRTGLQSAVELVADRITRPRYQEAQLNDARDLLLAELEAVEDDSAWRATRAALERLYPSSRAYGQPPEADASALRAIALADIQAFHDRRIRPDRTVIAVAGGRAEDAVKSVIHAFGDWQKAPGDRAGSTRDEAPRPAAGGRVHVSLPHKEQASVVVALPGLGPTQDDYVPLRALNYLLGETGYAGRLGQTLVDTGIAYAVYATLSRDPEGGPVLIQTNTVNPAEAVTRILDTLASFTRDGVTDAERLEAQGYLLGRLPFRFESASSATRALADLARTGRSAEWNAFAEKVRALTTADLERVAAIHYDQTRAVVAVAGR